MSITIALLRRILKEWAEKDLPTIELKANLVEVESMNIANFPSWFADSTKKTDDIDSRLYDSATGDSVISVLQTIRDTKLDISLSTLRDDLRGTGNKTLTDLDTRLGNIDARLYDSASGDTVLGVLQTIRDRTPSLTSAGNTPICVRERYVAWDSETLDSPSASTSYEFPSSGSWNVEGYTDIVVYVIADQPCDVKVQGSVDGTNFFDVPGLSIASADFVANALNHIAFSLVLKAIKVIVTTGSTAPSSITVYVGKRI